MCIIFHSAAWELGAEMAAPRTEQFRHERMYPFHFLWTANFVFLCAILKMMLSSERSAGIRREGNDVRMRCHMTQAREMQTLWPKQKLFCVCHNNFSRIEHESCIIISWISLDLCACSHRYQDYGMWLPVHRQRSDRNDGSLQQTAARSAHK